MTIKVLGMAIILQYQNEIIDIASLNYYSYIIYKEREGRGKGGGYERRDNTSESRVCGNIPIPTQLMCSMLLMHYYYQIFMS